VTLPGPELPLGAVAPLDSPPSDDEPLLDELLPWEVPFCEVLPDEECWADPPEAPGVLAELPPGSPSAMTPAAAALSTAAVTVATRTRAWPRSRSAAARRTSRAGDLPPPADPAGASEAGGTGIPGGPAQAQEVGWLPEAGYPSGPGEPARPGGPAGPVVAAESAGPGPPPGHAAGRAAAGGMGDGGSPGGPPLLFSCVMP
jgi:hypothetical protein